VTLTESSNNGTTATYKVSAPGAYAMGVFNGTTKTGSISGSSGTFSATVGKTYKVYAVKGPSTSSGLGVKTVTPARPADTTPPVTKSDAEASYVSAATVHLTATDAGGSGVAHTYYKLDGGTQTEGSSVVVAATGTHTIEYWSVDGDGNIESPHKTATFTVGIALPTSVTAVANATKVTYGGTTTFTGTLMSTSGLAGKQVVLQSSPNNSTWTNTSAVAVTDALGAYSLSTTSKTTTYYRVRYVGQSDLAPAMSSGTAVTPQVYLTKPTAPTSIRTGKTFTSYGYLKPRHTAGTYPVKIKAYRLQSGTWVLRKTVSAKASNYSTYTKYSKSMSLPYKGKWRLRTYHAADSKNAATYSSYRYVTAN
jgi:hypothetical protein